MLMHFNLIRFLDWILREDSLSKIDDYSKIFFKIKNRTISIKIQYVYKFIHRGII